MEDGQWSFLSNSDNETSSSFRQLASDSLGVPSPPGGGTPRQALKARPRGGSGRTTPVPKARQEETEDWRKLPGHVHFDESIYRPVRAGPNRPLQLTGHHLEKPEPAQSGGDQEAADAGESKPAKPLRKSSPSPHRWKHLPRQPISKVYGKQDLDISMKIRGSPLCGAPAAPAIPCRWTTVELRSEPGVEEHVEDVSSELPALCSKPKHRSRPGPAIHSVSKEVSTTGDEDEKPDVAESASSFVETVSSFGGEVQQALGPRQPQNSAPANKAGKESCTRQRSRKSARARPLHRSPTAERNERQELLPREFAKISRMIASARAKQQDQQKDASDIMPEDAIETASVEIQCEAFDTDASAKLDSSRTFMLFRCDAKAVTLHNWHRLEYPRPPMSKLELYLQCFEHRFPGALDPGFGT